MARIITDIATDENVAIKVFKQHKCNLPSFGMLVNTERRTKVLGLNMPDILQNLSKTATFIFWKFVKERNPTTNTVKYLPSNVAERRVLTKAYAELHKLGILKRVKQGEYIISPRAYIPSNNTFDTTQAQWDSL